MISRIRPANFWIRVRRANCWVRVRRHVLRREWSAALAALEKVARLPGAEKDLKIPLLRLFLLLSLKNADMVLEEFDSALSVIPNEKRARDRNYLEAYARMIGSIAFAMKHGLDAPMPSKFVCTVEHLATEGVSRVLILVLPRVPPGEFLDRPF